MELWNVRLAWAWILAGLVAGSVQGLFFHRADWLGGYGSWRRRMTRLGHVSFFGTGVINLLAVLTVRAIEVRFPPLASFLLALGALTMPAVCYASASVRAARHLFPLPVLSLVAGVAVLLARGLWP